MKQGGMVVVALLAAVLILGGGFWIYRNTQLARSGIKVDATVVDLRQEQDTDSRGRPRIRYYPVVEYRNEAGDLKRTQLNVSKTRNGASFYQVGDRITLYYDPKNPDRTTLDSVFDLYGPGGIALGIGLVLIAGSVLERRRR